MKPRNNERYKVSRPSQLLAHLTCTICIIDKFIDLQTIYSRSTLVKQLITNAPNRKKQLLINSCIAISLKYSHQHLLCKLHYVKEIPFKITDFTY